MKIHGLIIRTAAVLAMLTMSGTAAAQVLSFEKTRIEAGEISEDENPQYEYVCTNRTDKPIQIFRISTTCSSCLKAESDREIIRPGESATIKVSYFPKGHPGKFERRIFIFTDPAASAPTTVLELAISVKMGEDLSPYYRVNMGKIRMKTAELNFRKGRNDGICLEYLDITGKDFRPELMKEMLPPYLKIDVISPSQLAAYEEPDENMKGRIGEICITFDADMFPAEKESAEVPVILKGLGVRPAASTIKVRIK